MKISRHQEKQEEPLSLPPPTTGSFGSNLWSKILGEMLAGLLLAWSVTWRIRKRGIERLDNSVEGKQRSLVLFWHGQYLPLFSLFRGRPACVLTNRSFRGRVIGHISHRFGYRSIHLPEETGRRYLVALRQALADQILWGTAADGPRGPCHHINPSIMEMAARFGFTLWPVGMAAARQWRSGRRWDRMEIPLPFTRVGLVVGKPLKLSESPDPTDLREEICRLQESLDQCREEALKLL